MTFKRPVSVLVVIHTPSLEVLLLERASHAGYWQSVTGSQEADETLIDTARREVAEETGAVGAEVVRFLCRTLHAYYMHGRWELKATHWFEMRVSSSRALKPQREEGIDVAAWCPAAELKDRLEGMFPTVRRVFECLEK